MPLSFGNSSRERTLCWSVAGALAAAAAMLLAIAGVGIEMGTSALPLIPAMLGLILIRLRRDRSKVGIALFEGAELILLFIIVSASGAVASYAIATLTSGFVDPMLAAADARLGFSWVALYDWWSSHSLIAEAGRLAYGTIAFSPIVILGAAAAMGRADRARRFLLAFGCALIVALFLFCFFPARSAFAHHVGGHGPYIPTAGLQHLLQIEALRAGETRRISVDLLTGLITFPSFHACAAILMIWTAWPLRPLRMPVLAVNLMMLAATPIEGTHYLIDLIGGGALALFAIAVTERLVSGWPGRDGYARKAAPFPS